MIHGEEDGIITASHGRELVEASAAADKKFHPIPRAGHNDLFQIGGEEIFPLVSDFARRVSP